LSRLDLERSDGPSAGDCDDLLAEQVNTGPYFDVETHTWKVRTGYLAGWPGSLGLGPRCRVASFQLQRSPHKIFSAFKPSIPTARHHPRNVNEMPIPTAPNPNLPAVDPFSEARCEYVDHSAQCDLFPAAEDKTTYAKPSVSSPSVADLGVPAWPQSGLADFYSTPYWCKHKLPLPPPFKSLYN
jgi:hypothetical protein